MRGQATFDPVEQACDVALLIPSWSALKDWKERTHLYVHQRPLAAAVGSRVWLCKDRRLIWSYRIDDFLELSEALSGEAAEDGAGWALVVSDGRRAARDVDAIPDPHGVASRWMQGFRYLEPDAKGFVKAPRRPRTTAPMRPPDPVVEPSEPGRAQVGNEAPASSWASRLARRLGRRA